MRFSKTMEYSDFKTKVADALRGEVYFVETNYTKYDWDTKCPERNERRYRVVVGLALREFSKRYREYKHLNALNFNAWRNKQTFNEEADSLLLKKTTQSTPGNLRNAQSDIRFAIAFHYRLHAVEPAFSDFADMIDGFLFGEPLRKKGLTVFEAEVPKKPKKKFSKKTGLSANRNKSYATRLNLNGWLDVQSTRRRI